MKLGYLLTSIIDASQLQEWLLSDYLGEQFEEEKMRPLRKSTNFFVEAFSSAKLSKFSPYLLVTSVVVSIAQAAALFAIMQAYSLDRRLASILLFCGAALIFLYIKLRRSKKGPPKNAWVIGSVVAVGVGGGGLFALAKYGWPPGILLFCGAVLVTL